VTPQRRVARVSVPGFAPFALCVHPPGELVSERLLRHGIWEPYESSLLSRLLPPGGCLLDVGANLGYYSALGAQLVGAAGRVVAAEPDPDNFALLQANTAALAPVAAHCLALGATSGRAHLSANAANKGDLFVTRADGAGTVGLLAGDVLALDRVDLVKIDVQGAEAAVLRGLRDTLARNRGRVSLLVEAWPYGLERCGDSAATLLDELLALDLQVALLDHQRHVLSALDERALRTLLLETLTAAQQGFVNLLLHDRDRNIQAAAAASR